MWYFIWGISYFRLVTHSNPATCLLAWILSYVICKSFPHWCHFTKSLRGGRIVTRPQPGRGWNFQICIGCWDGICGETGVWGCEQYEFWEDCSRTWNIFWSRTEIMSIWNPHWLVVILCGLYEESERVSYNCPETPWTTLLTILWCERSCTSCCNVELYPKGSSYSSSYCQTALITGHDLFSRT